MSELMLYKEPQNEGKLKIPETVAVALEVIAGIYGNGEERIKKLKAAGYNVENVQKCVNNLLKLFEEFK